MKKRLGHYIVGGQIFTDKTPAVLHASATNNDIKWVFNDDVFDKIDWTVEPEIGLDQFYKMRAQQIRDEFDYVIIMASGGGDSTNVAWSFLNNGIHVDEIIAAAPFSGLKSWDHKTNDNTADNTISETIYAQLPLINEINQKYPNVKITLHDYFENMVDYKTDDWLLRSGDWIHPTSAARYDLEGFKHIVNLAESGKKVAIVYGIDKPNIIRSDDDSIKIVLSDLAVNVQRPPFSKEYPNVENILFYWSPDMPLMLVKQAHVLARWIFMPENAGVKQWMYDVKNPPKTFELNRIRQSTYERAIIPCIYPSTARVVFQGHKPTRLFLGEHDGWFYKLHANTRVYEMIDSDFRNFYKTINTKFLNKPRTGYNIYFKEFKIGPMSKFLPTIVQP
jgi:hypothetical protein